MTDLERHLSIARAAVARAEAAAVSLLPQRGRPAAPELHHPLAAELRTVSDALGGADAQLAAARAELRADEERLSVAQHFAGAGLWDWDIRADRVLWSDEYCDLYGLDPAKVEPSAEAWIETILPEDRDHAAGALRDCLARRDPDFFVEYRIRHPRRGLRWLVGRGRLICDERGEPIRLVGLNIDVTERKRAEDDFARSNEVLRREMEHEVAAREAAQARLFQTKKLDALGQLTGGVAHDFNNLLTVITSGAALLARTEDAERRARLTDSMLQAARRGAELTRRLLTFARRQALQPQALDLRTWLAEVRELLARSLRADIAVETRTPDGLRPALADPGELELALLNLAVNARDAMPRGGALRLSAENVTLDGLTDPDGLGGDFVRLSVADSGEGMASEVLARAFEPFFTTKEPGRGTGLGLGLAQVYGFARQSGGAARICSAPGRGTTVTLLLPCAARSAALPATPATAHPAPIATPTADAPHAHLRVLVVEDDDAVATMAVELLRRLGHDTERVATADEALAALAATAPFDLLFTDVIIAGGADGLDLARDVARSHPDLPVLLTSGYGGAPARVAAAGLPLLRKPYTTEDLSRAIAAATAPRVR